jgi:hypothetical protein
VPVRALLSWSRVRWNSLRRRVGDGEEVDGGGGVYICKVRQLVPARTVAYASSCVLTLIVLPL